MFQKSSQVAHIYGVRPKAARYRGGLSSEQHHEEVDSDEDRYPPVLAKIAEPPLNRLGAITKRLEQTGTANADTVQELKKVIASIPDSPTGIDAQSARYRAHAAEVFSTRDFSLTARQPSEAAESLPGDQSATR